MYKQLLMLAGFDRYIQIARCFRDEDLRADRQPEFTQIDLEMSFVDEEDVHGSGRRVHASASSRRCWAWTSSCPCQRMTYQEAMERFGSDKPDTPLWHGDLRTSPTLVKDCGFTVFDNALAAGRHCAGHQRQGRRRHSPARRSTSLTEFVKTYRVKGLAWAKISDSGEMSSSFAKFLQPASHGGPAAKSRGRQGQLGADRGGRRHGEAALDALGALRCEVARRLDVIPEGVYNFLWVTDFPMFEYGEDDEGNRRLYAKHHPFTAPKDEDLRLFETNRPSAMRAKAYDIVLNGTELGGGSIRIHRSDVQQQMFKALGFEEADIQERFGHMIEAFRYGAPPHGGLAYGLDRLVMLMAGRGQHPRRRSPSPKCRTPAT